MTTAPIRLVPLLVLALVVTACNGAEPTTTPTATPVPVPTIATDAPTATADDTGAPAPTAEEGTAAPTDAAGSATLLYFLLREGGARLWVEPVPFTYDPAEVDGAVARAAMTRLLDAEAAGGLVQPVPPGTQLLGVAVVDRVLQVDLSETVRTNPGLGAAGEEAFAQALAHTGGQFSTVDAVQLLVEGEEVSELWGHTDWSQPIAADEFAIVPIDVTQALGIASGGGSIELAGTANVFEAVFSIEVRDAGGNPVETGFVMATCGSGCRGDWTHTFSDLGPGTWTIVASEEDASDGEGFMPFSVETTVTIPG